ncbi:hypothetical protein, partial [Streptomyces sp. M2CJ-2]|uniref:hypothetical protein n=1 Tax=Streptomyces sp. M2CJ-2 TaxID=2803948 RepID=UPI001F19534D
RHRVTIPPPGIITHRNRHVAEKTSLSGPRDVVIGKVSAGRLCRSTPRGESGLAIGTAMSAQTGLNLSFLLNLMFNLGGSPGLLILASP